MVRDDDHGSNTVMFHYYHRLPEVIVQMLFRYFSTPTIMDMSRVSRQWQRLTHSVATHQYVYCEGQYQLALLATRVPDVHQHIVSLTVVCGKKYDKVDALQGTRIATFIERCHATATATTTTTAAVDTNTKTDGGEEIKSDSQPQVSSASRLTHLTIGWCGRDDLGALPVAPILTDLQSVTLAMMTVPPGLSFDHHATLTRISLERCIIAHPFTVGNHLRSLSLQDISFTNPRVVVDLSPAYRSLRDVSVNGIVTQFPSKQDQLRWRWLPLPSYTSPLHSHHVLYFTTSINAHACALCKAMVYKSWQCYECRYNGCMKCISPPPALMASTQFDSNTMALSSLRRVTFFANQHLKPESSSTSAAFIYELMAAIGGSPAAHLRMRHGDGHDSKKESGDGDDASYSRHHTNQLRELNLLFTIPNDIAPSAYYTRTVPPLATYLRSSLPLTSPSSSSSSNGAVPLLLSDHYHYHPWSSLLSVILWHAPAQQPWAMAHAQAITIAAPNLLRLQIGGYADKDDPSVWDGQLILREYDTWSQSSEWPQGRRPLRELRIVHSAPLLQLKQDALPTPLPRSIDDYVDVIGVYGWREMRTASLKTPKTSRATVGSSVPWLICELATSTGIHIQYQHVRPFKATITGSVARLLATKRVLRVFQQRKGQASLYQPIDRSHPELPNIGQICDTNCEINIAEAWRRYDARVATDIVNGGNPTPCANRECVCRIPRDKWTDWSMLSATPLINYYWVGTPIPDKPLIKHKKHKHQLSAYIGYNRQCDLCRVNIDGSACYSCEPCHFDVCMKCIPPAAIASSPQPPLTPSSAAATTTVHSDNVAA